MKLIVFVATLAFGSAVLAAPVDVDYLLAAREAELEDIYARTVNLTSPTLLQCSRSMIDPSTRIGSGTNGDQGNR
jgi:hypothetical protein